MKTITIKWSTNDVQSRAEDMGVEITAEQGDEILQNVFDNHDANIGVNWEVIEFHIEDFLENLNQ
jgi:hypothetical protein